MEAVPSATAGGAGHKTGTFAAQSVSAARHGCIALWRGMRTKGGLTATVSVLPATAVTGCANLAAHQLATVPNGLMAAVVCLASGFLGVRGLAHKWSPKATWTFLGVSAVTLGMGVAVAAGGYMDLFVWMAFASACFGGRLAYMDGTQEKHAKHKTEEAKAEAVKAKTGLTTLKAQTEQVVFQLKTEQLRKAMAPEPVPYVPDFSIFPAEEAALRRAFWAVHEAELMCCLTEPTKTGYAATIGLPVKLGREQVRTQWDKVSSALHVEGRFVLSNGRSTNELVAKFIDVNRRSDVDVTWNEGHLSKDPGMMSLGINTETGEPVLIHADERTLICGASGTGKSWSSRALMAHAHTYGDLVLIDGKGEEGTVWSSVARVAVETDEILSVIDELHAEMARRRDVMRGSGLSVWEGGQLTAVVDEGQVVLAMIASDKTEAKERLQRLRELSSLGRSRGVVLWWATQKPVMSGSAPGVDNLIAPNLLQRFSLRVADEQEARTALDDCAHYAPNLIPDDRSMRGHGYLKGFGPSLIQTWTMDDAAVRGLPVKRWGSSTPQGGATDADKVSRFFLAHPDGSNRAAAAELGFSESKVRRLR